MSKGGWEAPASALSEWTAEQVGGWVRSLVPNDQAHGAFEGTLRPGRKNACTEGRNGGAPTSSKKAIFRVVLARLKFVLLACNIVGGRDVISG